MGMGTWKSSESIIATTVTGRRVVARPFRIILPSWGISRARHTMLSTKAPRCLGGSRRGNHGKSLDRGHSRGMQLTFVESVYQQKRTYSPWFFSSLFSRSLFLSLFLVLSLSTRFFSSFTAKLSLLRGPRNHQFTLADQCNSSKKNVFFQTVFNLSRKI